MKNIYDGLQRRKNFPENGTEEWFADSPTMTRILRAMDQRQDIGDYGRLVFVIVARHFLSDREMAARLATQPGIGWLEAEGMIRVVQSHDYSPPTREQIVEWQSYQDFQISPRGQGDLYKELDFPDYIRTRMEEQPEEYAAEHA